MATPKPIRLLAAAGVFAFAARGFTARTFTEPLQNDEPAMINRGFMAGPLYQSYLRTGRVGPGWYSATWQPRKEPLG